MYVCTCLSVCLSVCLPVSLSLSPSLSLSLSLSLSHSFPNRSTDVLTGHLWEVVSEDWTVEEPYAWLLDGQESVDLEQTMAAAAAAVHQWQLYDFLCPKEQVVAEQLAASRGPLFLLKQRQQQLME